MISVITPTIPERREFLKECETSVMCQIGVDFEHIVREDGDREGNSVTVNKLAAEAKGDWLLPLADDDLLLPRCLETLSARRENADIIYSPPLVTGNEDRWWFFQTPPVIPATALIRRDLWDALDGYDETLAHEEDRALWIRALDAGARFVRVDEPCWIYRMHSANKSFNKKAVAA